MPSLRQKIGQMIIIGFAGTHINAQSPVAQWLANDGLGGVLFFDQDLATKTSGKNLVNKGQIQQLIQQLEYYSALSCPYPLFTALDYEGGVVDRLKSIPGCPTTLAPKELAALSVERFSQQVQQMAAILRELGFNLNFAPVIDLNLNGQQGIIGKLGRSFAADPQRVITLAQQFVTILADYGLISCYKHFPGHGSAIGDTHEGFVEVSATFVADELIPYPTLLQVKAPAMVMTAHVINHQLDATGLPATLSAPILTGILREQFNYDGVIISDDLQMRAIADHYSLADCLALTLNAGADMVIFANQLAQITAPEIIDCIEQLVLSEKVSLASIEQAYRRIITLKQKL